MRGKSIALVPARSGSKRVPKKNTRILAGKPLIFYTIQAALRSGEFSEIIVSTDSSEIGELARHFGASVPCLRPNAISGDQSEDLDWVKHCLSTMMVTNPDEIEFLAILRPTSPLRRSETIVEAMTLLKSNSWADSVRAMEPTSQHPGKMWFLDGKGLAKPLLPQPIGSTPTHNRPTQTLEKIWVQNASLEIVRLEALLMHNSISGKNVLGFEMPGYEGFDVNTELDWEMLERLIERNPNLLPG